MANSTDAHRKVLLLGATGKTGALVRNNLFADGETDLRLYVRTPQKLDPVWSERAQVIIGDMADSDGLQTAVAGSDWVVACLNGNPLLHAQSLVAALAGQPVKRVVWLTGLGVQGEVPGAMGKMLAGYARRQPDFVEAARIVDECPTPSLLVRAPMLTDGPEGKYTVQRPNEHLQGDHASRATVARFIADAVEGRVPLRVNESLGVTEV